MARRGSEPTKSLIETLSISHLSEGNTVCQESKRKARTKPRHYTYHTFIFSFEENRDEGENVSNLLKSHGFLCADSHSDIKPNQPEFDQISDKMIKSQWIVLVFSKQSFILDLEGYMRLVSGIAVNIAAKRKRKCLISVLEDVSYCDFIPNQLSAYFQVNQNKKDWESKLIYILDKRTREQLTRKRVCHNAALELIRSQSSNPHTRRRRSLPGKVLSLLDVFQKRQFCEPLLETLAAATYSGKGKVEQVLVTSICEPNQVQLPAIQVERSSTNKASIPEEKQLKCSGSRFLPPIEPWSTERAPVCGLPSTLSLVVIDTEYEKEKRPNQGRIQKTQQGSERKKALERFEKTEQKWKHRELQLKPKRK